MTKDLRGSIKAIDDKISKLKEQQRSIFIAAQKKCKHKIIVEGDYRSSNMFGFSQPPFYVCMACGLAEEQWHCGPWIHFVEQGVKRTIVRQDREEAWKLIVGPLIKQDELEGLGRFGVERGLQWCIDNKRLDLPARSPLPHYQLPRSARP